MGPPAETEQPREQHFGSPWDEDYGPLPTVSRGRMRAVDAPEVEADEDEGWAIVPQARGPDSGALGGGSHSAARNRGPMVPLEQIRSLPVWQQTGHPSAITPAMWARHVVRNVNTSVFNLVLISLLVGILGIPVYIGYQRIRQLQPIPVSVPTVPAKVEPTAAVAEGFTPFQSPHFSLAYPSDWTHTSHNDPLSNGRNVLHSDDFTGTHNSDEVLVGTTQSVPGDQLQGFLDDVTHQQFSQWTPQGLAHNRHVTYDHEQWLENDYAVPVLQGKTNVTLEAHVLVANHGTFTYYLILISTRSSFAADAAKYGNPMLASFRFQG